MSVVRYPGKPTSGRYVYRNGLRAWAWQCDLHYDLNVGEETPGGDATTMTNAFAGALAHAANCPHSNEERTAWT